eukprot:scpid62414/ scgid26682/ KH domain-containing, RNA-binding, signal transduction-associated protein 2; Sam68-like mammalian protein 1
MDAEKYLPQLLAERDRLDPALAHCLRLLDKEIDTVKAGRAKATAEQVHLSEKVFVPAKDFPGYNFVGRLLGPRGLSLKRMQSETGCRLTIMGRGSVRDSAKEDELRESGDSKYDHLNEDLHVLVEAKGNENLAAARLAAGVAEVRKMLIPGDANDQIRNEQLRELALLKGIQEQSETIASVRSDSFPVAEHAPRAPARSRAAAVQPRQPAIYAAAAAAMAAAAEPHDYAPVMMVPRQMERLPAGLAYAKAPSFEDAYLESAGRSRRYSEYAEPAIQMVPVVRPTGGLSAHSLPRTMTAPRTRKRFEPYQGVHNSTPGHY